MRVLVVSQYFWPENFRINDLVTELIQRGHDVTVLTGYPNYPDGKIFPGFASNPNAYSEYNGAKVIRVPLVPRGKGGIRLILNYVSFATTACLLGAWKLRRQQFEVIFVYEPSPITVGIPSAFFRIIKKAPVAFWVLDLWPETLRAIGVVKSKSVLKAVGKLVSFVYRRCDLILAQSKSFIPEIRKYCAESQRIAYFPSWAESVFDMENIAPAHEIPTRADAFNVMFAGNIGDAQDFPAILTAAELLKSQSHIRWLIVGDGRIAKWVQQEIAKRSLQSSVLMLGRHPIERMPSFYKHADALLVSLKDEPIFSMTIPGKLQSYLAAGIPVIAMLNGEGADVVAQSQSGLTCPAGDASALAAAVLKLASFSTQQRNEFGKNGLAVSQSEFDRDRLITRLENWLQELSKKTEPTLLEAKK